MAEIIFVDKDKVGSGGFSIVADGELVLLYLQYDITHGVTIQLWPNEAHRIANWILENIPEEE